jgi:hypothetical protein
MYYVCYLAISIGDAHVPDVDFYFGREVRIIDNCALGRCCCTQRERGGRQAGKGTDSDNSYAVVMVRLFRSPPHHLLLHRSIVVYREDTRSANWGAAAVALMDDSR